MYQAFVERKREIERAVKERNEDIQPQTEFDKKAVEDTDINDVVKKTSSAPVIERDNSTEAMTPQQRAAQVYKERKQKELESVES